MEHITIGIKFFISLLSILNPIGALPFFITITRQYSQEEIKKVAINCSYALIVTLLVSLFFGKYILGFFGITLTSFRLAGGVLISMSAFSMLRAQQSAEKMNQEEMDRQSQIREIGIVPLAIPMLAGPGAISSCIINAERFTGISQWLISIVVILLISLLIFGILNNARKIRERIGRITLNVMTRIMGLILLAVAVEYIALGIKGLFPMLA